MLLTLITSASHFCPWVSVLPGVYDYLLLKLAWICLKIKIVEKTVAVEINIISQFFICVLKQSSSTHMSTEDVYYPIIKPKQWKRLGPC